MSRAETLARLKARTADRKARGLIPDYPRASSGEASAPSPPRAALLRPLPCVELGPKPGNCACGSGVRLCGLGNGEIDGVRGRVRHAAECQTCEEYAAREHGG
jgi:hypothetical protein